MRKKGSKAEVDWMAVRAQAVRQSWPLLTLREVWMGFGFWMLLLERLLYAFESLTSTADC